MANHTSKLSIRVVCGIHANSLPFLAKCIRCSLIATSHLDPVQQYQKRKAKKDATSGTTTSGIVCFTLGRIYSKILNLGLSRLEPVHYEIFPALVPGKNGRV